jgi:NTE family protein
VTRALVLGGGGITGIAWELGLIAGLADAGVDLRDADLVIGTSAGSVVGVDLRSGVPVEELYQGQLAPPTGELAARFGPWQMARWAWAALLGGDERAVLARLGRMALRARTVPEQERRDVIAGRLPTEEWPEGRLIVTAVVAETGEFLAIDRSAGVPLVDAVAASCAVPLVWPPMTVAGRRCVDGGVRSPTNADLARGCDAVLVIAPVTRALRSGARLSRQIASLGPGVRAEVITPSPASQARMGSNVLDPAFRAASARAGREQAAQEVERVRGLWGSSPPGPRPPAPPDAPSPG